MPAHFSTSRSPAQPPIDPGPHWVSWSAVPGPDQLVRPAWSPDQLARRPRSGPAGTVQ